MAAHDAVDPKAFIDRMVELPEVEAVVYALIVRGIAGEEGRAGLTVLGEFWAQETGIPVDRIKCAVDGLAQRGLIRSRSVFDVAITDHGGWRGPESTIR